MNYEEEVSKMVAKILNPPPKPQINWSKRLINNLINKPLTKL